MSTNGECTVAGCEDAPHRRGLCVAHYFRWRRHGNPYIKRAPICKTCLEATKILRRPSNGTNDDLEKFTDLYLLFKTGSAYRLRTKDERGREYDLEDDLRRDHARQ